MSMCFVRPLSHCVFGECDRATVVLVDGRAPLWEAKLPKELMLYVKNLVFLDGAIARLAPDLDLLAEVANISMMFAAKHGERLGRELGVDHTAVEFEDPAAATGGAAELGLTLGKLQFSSAIELRDPGRHPEVAVDLERMPEPDGAMATDTA